MKAIRFTTNIFLTVGLILIGATLAMAAPISWEPVTNTSSPTDVRTDGTLVEAINATSAAGSVTVNSVTFSNSDVLLPNSVGAGFLDGASTGDTSYDALLDTLDFGGGTSTAITLADGLLTSGDDYLVQLWFTDLRGCCSGRTMTYGDGEPTENLVDVDASTGGFGQFAVGTFTADDDNQTLTLATNGFGNAHINALQVRALPTVVPEPTTFVVWTLLGVATICLLRWRQRVQ